MTVGLFSKKQKAAVRRKIMFVWQIVLGFVLSMLASYGASIIFTSCGARVGYGAPMGKKRRVALWAILSTVLIGVSAFVVWRTYEEKKAAVYAASCPKESLVEFLIREQRQETQGKLKDNAKDILDEIKKSCFREDGDVDEAPDLIASFLRPRMQEFARNTKATGIMMELISPVHGKSLYEWIEDCENIIVRTENGKPITRAENALIKGVRDFCNKYSKIIKAVTTARQPELPPNFELSDFFNTVVPDAAELLDDETVHKYYKEAIEKISDG